MLSGPHPGKDMEKDAVQKLILSMNELSEYSGKYNLKFELETFDFDIDKKCLIGKSDVAAGMAKEVRKDLILLTSLSLAYKKSLLCYFYQKERSIYENFRPVFINSIFYFFNN